MYKNNSELIYTRLNDMFASPFKAQYNLMEEKHKKIMAEYAVQLYRRWYYSSIVSNTMLTPANFVSHIDGELFVPFSLGEVTLTSGLGADFISCGIKKHYIYEDLHFIASAAGGGIRLEKDGSVEKTVLQSLCDGVHIKSENYILYLIELLEILGIVEQLPSINTRVYALKNEDFNTDMHKIAVASCTLASQKLNEVFGSDEIDGSELFSYLKYNSVDKIIIDIFRSKGIEDMEEIFKKDITALDTYERNLLTMTACFSEVLDRWFITVFSFYLRLIQPIFTQRFDFKAEAELLVRLAEKGGRSAVNRVLFRCPSLFNLTRAGAEVTGCEFEDTQGAAFDKADMLTMLNCAVEGAKLEELEKEHVSHRKGEAKRFKPTIV